MLLVILQERADTTEDQDPTPGDIALLKILDAIAKRKRSTESINLLHLLQVVKDRRKNQRNIKKEAHHLLTLIRVIDISITI